MIKVAFIGRQRSGKTTGATALRHHLLHGSGLDGGLWEDVTIYTTSFGKRMKEEFEKFTGEKFDKKEHRKMIQLFGQLHRHYQDDIWISYVEAELLNAERKGFSHFIIDDVRQANEVAWCKRKGFILVYVDVPLVELEKRCIDLGEDFTPNHTTEQVEQFYLDANLRVINHGPIEEFKDDLIYGITQVIDDIGGSDNG